MSYNSSINRANVNNVKDGMIDKIPIATKQGFFLSIISSSSFKQKEALTL